MRSPTILLPAAPVLAPAGRLVPARMSGGAAVSVGSPRPQMLARPRLEAALDGVLGHRLGLVVADAGFGKTTLLNSWAGGLNAVVHDVTLTDRDVLGFAGRVVGALHACVPALSSGLLGLGDVGHRTGPGGQSTPPDALAEFVGATLEQHLRRDVVLALDNVHLLGEGLSARFLGGLIRHAPPLLHIVLAGRTAPPVCVDRLRRQGEVVELQGADLGFTLGEVEALLGAVLGPQAVDMAAAVHRQTAGWPAAVRLSVEALREAEPDTRAEYLARLVGERGLVSRLAGSVYEHEPAAVKRLLGAAALFEEVTVELLEAIDIPARGSLAALVRRGLFVERGAWGAGWYRLHAIAREAVAAGGLDEDEMARLRVAGADWFAANGLPQAALRSLVAAGRHAETTRLLRRSGQDLLRRGHASDVVAAVNSLPDDARGVSAERLAGEALQLRGEWEQALACYARAAPDRGMMDPGLAWRMGLIHYLRGEPDAAIAIYERGEIGEGPTRDTALLLAWMASAHWGRGDADTCGALAIRALHIAATLDDAQALAAAHTVLCMLAVLEGDRRANDGHYRKALQQAERAGDVLQLVRIRTNRGSHLVDEGAYAEAEEELDHAISMADLSGFVAFGALALNNRGEARLGLGRLEEAHADLEASAAVFDELGSGLLAHPLQSLGTIASLRGDTTAARKAFQQALELTEAAGDVQAQVPALSGLARLLAEEDPACAAELADRAVTMGKDLGMVCALLAAGWVALAAGDRAAARRRAREAVVAAESRRDHPGAVEAMVLEAAATDDDRHALALTDRARKLLFDLDDPIGLARATLVRADHLDDVAARPMLEGVQARVRAIGCKALDAQVTAALASREPKPAPSLRIETLGGFRLFRDGKLVPGSTWKSRKARDVLKILIARRGRAVTRECLMDILWRGDTSADVSNRFNVALSTVRSVLDPQRQAGSHELIGGDADAVWLDLRQLDIDVESFLADAATGLRLLREHRDADAYEHLLRAEATYTGDFLEDSPYDDWAVPLREQARAAYRQVAARLARHARDRADADAAVRYLLRILELDPYDEHSHLELVSVLATSGRHGDARRHYRAYSTRMNELGVEAVPFEAECLTSRFFTRS